MESSFLIKLAVQALLGPLSVAAKASLALAIKEWYKLCQKTPSPLDDALAKSIAEILGVDVEEA